MDKNTIIGFLLIGVIIIAFTILNRPSKEQIAEQQRLRDSIQQVEIQKAALEAERLATDSSQPALDIKQQNTVSDFFATGTSVARDSIGTQTDSTTTVKPTAEEFVTLENEKLKLVLSTLGGRIYSVQLKGEKKFNGDSLYLFEGDEARFNLELFNRNSVRLSTADQVFTPMPTADGKSVVMRLENSPGQHIDLIYTLPANEFMLGFNIRIAGMKNGLHPESLTNFRINWEQKIRQQEQGRQFENRFARLNYRYMGQDVQRLSDSKSDRRELTEPVKWFSFKDQFFSTIIIAEKPFSNTILSSQPLSASEYIKDYKAETWVPVTTDPQKDELTASFNYYFGPNHFYTLKNYDKEIKESSQKLYLEELVDLGYKWLSWINKYFTIPVFNFFLKFDWGMGVIILIMTLLIKLIILPLTYKSFKSSAKMRVLRPQIKEIEAKYPGQDKEIMLKRQQATMDLYNKAGASPMSGCFPMLLQMPILLAFFFFFPSAIELRQQSFLWAHDLSTFDSIISWDASIPFISKILGNHISLFCLLMTVVNVFYTKYNMAATDTGQTQMPGMKSMPILMSVMMFFFLNSYPAGLNYYYFLSTLFTIGFTFLFKQFLDEDKLLAQLEANKKKPKKQSGFMARLAEAQKIQEKQARERAKETAKKNYRR
ncbi:MAG: membrane protein insertase YidC [Petrimonas sp.]|uniref:membrane protein insertase YidC n=1 Tax=Petrimonas sp. TaxID=2023866 RepID=UPI002B391C0C|nr:membrane protein insertase YidC [Petrimonas sp.]MEA5044181.1 membrane protein insertase YidC [Petrimonas sp.]